MALTPQVYYLDDWDTIKSIYDSYIKENKDQIESLQAWLRKEPHLPIVPKQFLAKLFRIGNESTEVTKEILDSILTYKTRNPEMFTNRLQSMKKVEQLLDLVEVAVPDPWEVSVRGMRLSYGRLVDTDPNKLLFHEAMQVFLAVLDFEMARVVPATTGVCGIIDMEGFHIGFIPRLNVMDLAVVLKYIQIVEHFVAEVYVINCNNLIQTVMGMVRPFLSKNLASKLNFFTPNQMDEFYKKIPKSCVPSTYGGELESMTECNKKFRQRFRGAEDFIRELDSPKYNVKEDLRRGYTGPQVMSGSFRKLCID